MDDYASYIRSFVSISDDEMRKRVEQHLNDGHLWPEPLLTFNPSFAKVGRIEELVASKVLAAPLPPALGGAEGLGLLITIRVLLLVSAASAVFASERRCNRPRQQSVIKVWAAWAGPV